MLKIALKRTSPAHAVYALAGEITADQLPRLEALATASLEAGRALSLDMEWVWRVDGEAIAFFTSGPGRHVRLVGLPDGLAEWLRSATREDP
jgi:hypothetical protein